MQCSVRPNGPTLQSVKSWQIKPKVSFSPLPGLEEILQKVRIPMPLQNQTSQVGDLTTNTRCPKLIISINTEPFPGLKESKLGILAESKLTPSSGAVSITTDKVAPAVDDKKAPHTFNFAPLSKPSPEDVAKEKTADEENKNPNLEETVPADTGDSSQFVFGQNLVARVENVSEEAGKAKNGKSEVQQEEEDGSTVESQSQESSKTDLLFTNSVSPSTKTGEREIEYEIFSVIVDLHCR